MKGKKTKEGRGKKGRKEGEERKIGKIKISVNKEVFPF